MRRGTGGLFLTLVLILGACGDDAEPQAGPSPSPGGGSFPVTVEAANGPVTMDERPERIVSLSPTATEMLFAIGAGDQIVAVDDQSNYPPEAPVTDLSGFEPNIEAIAGYEPDLVVISNDISDLIASLEGLDIPVLLQPAAEDLQGTYEQMEQLGELTGQPSGASDEVREMQAAIDELLEEVPEFVRAPTHYFELDPTFFTVTSDTFVGQVLAMIGMQSIADEAEGASSGYPQLSSEFIVAANPDFIFLADTKCCGESAESVAARPGWDGIQAVQEGNVVALDDDVASRWGPRVVDLLEVVVEAVAGAGS
ncbi:MAG TPA: ABC transporter substrate-binding protein [Actinomycetota bacterium]